MARDYTLSFFLRQTPWELLKEYFDGRGILTDVDFTDLKKREHEPVLEAIEALDDGTRATIDRDFQEIFELATPQGARVMVDEAAILELDIAGMIEAMENHFQRAMWLFLNKTQGGTNMFETCLTLSSVERLRYNQSRSLKDLPAKDPGHDAATLEEMTNALRVIYARQGRGYKCKVEHYRRPNPDRHYYVALPEDYATSGLQYDGDTLVRIPRKSVFQVVYIFRPKEGLLEMSAPGDKREIRELQEVFCRYALGMPHAPDVKSERCYELNGLKDRAVKFPTDPKDGFKKVEVMALRLNQAGNKRRSILVSQDPGGNESLHDWLDRVLDATKVPLRMLDVSQAKIRAEWYPEQGKKARTLTFTLSLPDSSSLKDLPHHEQIKKYLKDWKLAV